MYRTKCVPSADNVFDLAPFVILPANFCSSGCLRKPLVLEGVDRAQKVLAPCPTTGGRRRAPANVRSPRPRNGRVSRSVLESKASGMHPRSMASLTEFSLADATANSHPRSRNPECTIARAAEHLGTQQRRKRRRGPPDLRRAHRLDAAGADHAGER
jgi:hypothetical protein